MRTLLALTLAGLSLAAAADDIYRWTDSNGVVHYSDKPQAPTDKPVALPNLQTYTHGGTPPGFAPVPQPAPRAAAAADSGTSVSIVSPAADETIRDAEGKFTVSVNAQVGSGQGLVYYLDGGAVNTEPTPSTAWLYTGVERGDHSLAVAMVDTGGHELGRSAPVTIHMMPPKLRR